MNRVFGATLLVAGTAIGAGTLALPIESSSLGFLPSIGLMLIMWVFMTLSALLTVELFFKHPYCETLPTLAKQTLGPLGYMLSILSLLGLFYSLLAAYTIGGATIVSLNMFNAEFIAPLFVLPFAYITYKAYELVDYVNRYLFILMLAAFVILMIILIPSAQVSLDTGSWLFKGGVISVFFTSFGYHGSIPVIINYVGHNKNQLRFVFIAGSFIALLFYMLWLLASFGNLPVMPTTLDGFLNELAFKKCGFLIVKTFSLLAIITSFLGVGLSLFDLIREKIKNRLVTVVLTFLPPLLLAMVYPAGFIYALRYAASALSLFGIVIPSLIALRSGYVTSALILLIFGIYIIVLG